MDYVAIFNAFVAYYAGNMPGVLNGVLDGFTMTPAPSTDDFAKFGGGLPIYQNLPYSLGSDGKELKAGRLPDTLRRIWRHEVADTAGSLAFNYGKRAQLWDGISHFAFDRNDTGLMNSLKVTDEICSHGLLESFKTYAGRVWGAFSDNKASLVLQANVGKTIPHVLRLVEEGDDLMRVSRLAHSARTMVLPPDNRGILALAYFFGDADELAAPNGALSGLLSADVDLAKELKQATSLHRTAMEAVTVVNPMGDPVRSVNEAKRILALMLKRMREAHIERLLVPMAGVLLAVGVLAFYSSGHQNEDKVRAGV